MSYTTEDTFENKLEQSAESKVKEIMAAETVSDFLKNSKNPVDRMIGAMRGDGLGRLLSKKPKKVMTKTGARAAARQARQGLYMKQVDVNCKYPFIIQKTK